MISLKIFNKLYINITNGVKLRNLNKATLYGWSLFIHKPYITIKILITKVKKLIFISLIVLFKFNYSYSQNAIKLKDVYYKTYDDFIAKKASKEILIPLKIKNRFGSPSFTIKDQNDNKLNNYFAIVQNDSILLKAKDVEEKFKDNKKVLFSNNKNDYFLAIGSTESEIYFRQLNNSQSFKYTGFGIATPISFLFNFENFKFYVFFKRTELVKYLEDKNRADLTNLLSINKKLDYKEVINVMERYFEIKNKGDK